VVTVYIITTDIIAGLIRAGTYFWWWPFPLKFIYPQIIKYLLYNLIIFDKGDYPHLAPAQGTNKWVHFIYLLHKPCPRPIQAPGSFIFYDMIFRLIPFFFKSYPCDITVCCLKLFPQFEFQLPSILFVLISYIIHNCFFIQSYRRYTIAP